MCFSVGGIASEKQKPLSLSLSLSLKLNKALYTGTSTL